MAEVVFGSLQYANAVDLEAMAQYLKSLAPQPAARAQLLRADDEILYQGQMLYSKQCASCHGAQGEGSDPIGPALAHNRALLMTQLVNPIRTVLFGGYAPGTAANAKPFGMPPFSEQLSDDQIAAVLTYIRQAWGNSASPVGASAIAPERGSPLW
jgi:mono/diheme cytochrome c family protein